MRRSSEIATLRITGIFLLSDTRPYRSSKLPAQTGRSATLVVRIHLPPRDSIRSPNCPLAYPPRPPRPPPWHTPRSAATSHLRGPMRCSRAGMGGERCCPSSGHRHGYSRESPHGHPGCGWRVGFGSGISLRHCVRGIAGTFHTHVCHHDRHQLTALGKTRSCATAIRRQICAWRTQRAPSHRAPTAPMADPV